MSWNYRVVKYAAPDTGYGLHEVYYDDEGKEVKMGSFPCGFVGDSPEEIISTLLVAHVDAGKRPVFNEPPEWSHVKAPLEKTERAE